MSQRNPRVAKLDLPVQEENGHFGIGFFVGVISGAAGMFLFGTKQGRHILRGLRTEFERDLQPLLQEEAKQKLLPALEETKTHVEKAVGTLKTSFPKFQKKQL